MKKQSRNDPCHCGSGKKFKNCHAGQTNNNFNQQWVIVVIIGVIFLFFYFMDSGTSTTTINNSIPTSVIPQDRARSTTPPPGETPPGKVWSPEHGHWHYIQYYFPDLENEKPSNSHYIFAVGNILQHNVEPSSA